MRTLPLRSFFYLFIDVTLLVLGITNIPSIVVRAKVPFDARQSAEGVIISHTLQPQQSGGLAEGDRILSFDSSPVLVPEELEFLGDFHTISRKVSVDYERSGLRGSTLVTLVPYYDTARFAVTTLIVGFVVWCVGVLLLMRRPGDLSASTLHWSMMFLSATILLTWGTISHTELVTYARRALWNLSYTMVGASFFFFTTLFPKPKFGLVIRKAALILTPALVLSILQIYFHSRAIRSVSSPDFVQYQATFDVFTVVLLSYGAATILNFIDSYRKSESFEEKKKLEWILWGLITGALPFLLLVKLPQVFSLPAIVPEEITTIFFLAMPIALAISFIRYKILDVEIVINRSIVYTTLSVFFGGVYFLVILLTTSVVSGPTVFKESLFVVAVSLVVAFVFNPLRTRLQHLVDETLFPARANFRQVTKEVVDDLHRALSTEEFFRRITGAVERLIPVSTVAVYRYENTAMNLMDLRGVPLHRNFYLSQKNAAMIAHPKVYALPATISFHRDDIEFEWAEWLKKLGISVCVPLLRESNKLIGAVAINSRSPGDRFDEAEIDLLVTICNEASIVLERLLLQERLILEREEKKRAEELNRLKSYFVSSVSHELRTPLTSIRMFAETLRNAKLKNARQQKEYLEIMEGESERLARLIDNVLDFSKIERGVKEYNLVKTNPNEIVQRAVDAVGYQFKSAGMKLRLRVARKLPDTRADADALEEVIINLLSNALKYSGSKKEVTLGANRSGNHFEISVADRGIGIPESDFLKIFDPFYRVRDGRASQAGGTGLGLALVKHIVEAHRGTISVKSTVGKGSTFTIRLPILE